MNEFRSVREKAAYEAGRAAERDRQADDGPTLTREQVRAMSPDEVNANWQAVQRSLNEGLPSEQDES